MRKIFDMENPVMRALAAAADLIVLNKCDLPGAAEREADKAWLAEQYPQARVITISAVGGDGLEELSL